MASVNSPSQGSHAGRFSYDVLTGKWDWDDSVFRIHGREPGSVEPSIDLVLGEQERSRVHDLLEHVTESRGPFSIPYRIEVDPGVDRHLVLIGTGGIRGADEAATLEGYCIDLTEEFAASSEEYASAAVAASAVHRAVIEQAKGAVMFAYGLGSDQAFAMLRWWSRNRNVKLHDLAAQLVDRARGGHFSSADLRGGVDVFLHDVIRSVTAPQE